MLPIASLLSNPIPQAVVITPGLAPVIVMVGVLLVGVVEVFRAVRAQRRVRRPARAAILPLAVRRPTTAAVGNR